MGRKDIKRKKRKLSYKRKPKINWWHPAVIMPILEAVAQGYTGGVSSHDSCLHEDHRHVVCVMPA